MTGGLLKLMQIADSALPVGSFAYSNGLEWMVKTDLLSTFSQFRSYLEGLVRQFTNFEFAFINSFCSNDSDSLTALRVYDSTIPVPEMYKASLTTGKSWLRILPGLFPAKCHMEECSRLGDEIQGYLALNGVRPHFLYVFAKSLSGLGFSRNWIKLLYAYMAVRDQMSAAIRLGSLGPNQAQQIQSEILALAEEIISSAPELEYVEAYKTTVLPDLAQGGHSGLYSKLFQT